VRARQSEAKSLGAGSPSASKATTFEVTVVVAMIASSRRLVFIARESGAGNTSRTGHIFAGYVYYLRKGGLLEKRSAERSPGKLVAAALPLIYGNRRDSYGKVTAASSIKRRAACPRGNPRRTNRKSRKGQDARAEHSGASFPSSRAAANSA